MFLRSLLTAACLLTTSAFAAISWAVEPFNPPAIPLAVKHPYLNTWLMQGSGVALNDAWSGFWTGNSITAWTGFVRVDGKPYRWLVSLTYSIALTAHSACVGCCWNFRSRTRSSDVVPPDFSPERVHLHCWACQPHRDFPLCGESRGPASSLHSVLLPLCRCCLSRRRDS